MPLDAVPIAEAVVAVSPAELSAAQVLAQAERLLARGEVDQASVLVEALAAQDDGGAQRQFLQGLIALERRQYRLAADLFRAILVDQPGVARVRLELARALFLNRQWSAADYHFRLADTAALPPATRAIIRTFRGRIRAERVWTASVELGIAPDSNINQGSSGETAFIYGRPFILSNDARRQTGIGVSFAGNAELRLRRRPNSALVLSGFTSLTQYDGSAFDDLLFGGEIGRQQRVGRGRATLAATGFRRWYGNRPYAVGYGLRGQYEPAPARWQTLYQGSLQRIAYDYAPAQTGYAAGLGFGIGRAVSSTSFASLQLAATRQTARDPGFAFVSGRATISYLQELPFGLSATADATIERTGYDAALPAYGPDQRRDVRTRFGASIAKRDWLFLGFAPALRFTQSRLYSNIPLFDYSRRRIEFTVVRPF